MNEGLDAWTPNRTLLFLRPAVLGEGGMSQDWMDGSVTSVCRVPYLCGWLCGVCLSVPLTCVGILTALLV